MAAHISNVGLVPAQGFVFDDIARDRHGAWRSVEVGRGVAVDALLV
jgi:hypothetical protein